MKRHLTYTLLAALGIAAGFSLAYGQGKPQPKPHKRITIGALGDIPQGARVTLWIYGGAKVEGRLLANNNGILKIARGGARLTWLIKVAEQSVIAIAEERNIPKSLSSIKRTK